MPALLHAEGVTKSYLLRGGWFAPPREIQALAGVDLEVMRGETLALVGESGSGKTTLGRCITRAERLTHGRMRYFPAGGGEVDLGPLRERELKPWRREIRMVFQDPFSSLNSRMTVFDIVAEPLRIHGLARRPELRDRVAAVLRKVGMGPDAMQRYPHAFSGGQRQRIGIARTLVLDPRLVIADEAVSALDVSIKAQILNLLDDLKAELDLTYLFITHDLGVVSYIADRVAVMYLGQIVEVAAVDTLFERPRHPYSELLLSALPLPDPRRRRERKGAVRGEPAFLGARPSGCPFHPRCGYATELCPQERPPLRDVGGGVLAACHYAEELSLRGAFDLRAPPGARRPAPPNSGPPLAPEDRPALAADQAPALTLNDLQKAPDAR